jgi:nucleoside phosphorylase
MSRNNIEAVLTAHPALLLAGVRAPIMLWPHQQKQADRSHSDSEDSATQMTYRTADDILEEAKRRNMRRAFVVTALLLEMKAVRAHLTDMGSVLGRHGTIYECGCYTDRGQEWLIVVAETGTGTHPAHSVASDAHVVFGKFEVQILVGVGGSRKADAPLGSVVASDKIYWPYGGKAGKEFTHRPNMFPLDLRLVGLARKIRSDAAWPSRILPPRGGALPAFDAYPVDFPPTGLVAPIASIEAVLDHPKSELEALIAKGWSDTHVVEMEGYGAVYAASAEQTPSIVIRGVSDMRRKKSAAKDKILQPIAACHAAAFAFEMLSHFGQLYPAPEPRDGASPPDPLLAQPIDTEAAAPALSTVPAPTPSEPPQNRISIVLNLSIDFGPENGERIERLQDSLRAITSNERIEIVKAEAGSLRLFVADPDAALARLGVDALRKGLAEREDADLTGMLPFADYERLAGIRAAFVAASTDLLAWPTALPGGETIERPEMDQLRARIDDYSASTTALLGEPGAGKSALLATIGNAYAARGLPVLAIKADLLDADIASDEDLQARLGLDAPPSELIATLAAYGPVLLLVDQLDALAQHLDIRTGRLSILLNLIRKLGGRDNVHIVLSSRTFEFQHDVRLKTVAAESLTLQLPAWSEVVTLLEARGIDAGGWPADAQDVLRRPQALAIYLQLSGRFQSESFTSYQAMLEQLWSERVLVGDTAAAREQLAADLADQMADRESLWLPAARFADRTPQLRALEGAGVLAVVDGSVGFSHQTLFEFALARSFAREPGRLSAFVLGRQSSLFIRPKLWAGLAYLRAVDITVYHDEIETIWRAADLRPHLRALLIDFLGAQQKPTDREALLMADILGADELHLRGLRALSGSRGWFECFKRSFIAEAMTRSDETANHLIDILSRALTFDTEGVLALAKERWLPHSRHDSRLWWLLQAVTNWTDDIFEIAAEVIGRADIAPMMIDHLAGTIGVEQPDVALKIVLARLRRDLAGAVEAAAARAAKPRPEIASPDEEMAWRMREDPREPVKRLIERGDEWDSLPALAEQAPQAFLDILWPWYRDVFEALARFAEPREMSVGYALPYDADFRFEDEAHIDLPEHALLGATRIAVEQLAESDPEAFARWASANDAVPLGPVQRLIAHGIAHQPEQLASLGLDFILGDERRYYLGSIHDLHGTAKALIAAASPHWSKTGTARFEAAVRAYAPPPPPEMDDPKSRMSWRHSNRRTQLDLLRALPAHRLSAAARRQVTEDERRYGSRRSGTTFTGPQWIGSVMEAEAMAKASDADIVHAFEELPDTTGWDHPRSWMAGGNIQLARAFSTFAKGHPDRAIRILTELNEGNGTRAAAYALDSLSENAEPALVMDLLRDVVDRGFNGTEFRHSAARALERLARRGAPIDEALLALLESWLDASPADADEGYGEEDEAGAAADLFGAEDATRSDARAGGEQAEADDRESLLWGYGGFGVVPGGTYPVIEALVQMRLRRDEPDAALAALSTYLDRNQSLEEWSFLAHFFPYLHRADTARWEAFLDSLFAKVPGLIGTRLTAQFLAHSRALHPALVERHLADWRDARSRPARQAYGEIVALAALLNPEVVWGKPRLDAILVDAVVADARAGAALSAAHIFADGDRRTEAAALLVRLLETGEPGVWRAVFDVFRIVDELTSDEGTVALLQAIADRIDQAPRVDATFVVERLSSLLPHHAVLVGTLAQRLADKWRAELSDVQTATAMATSQLVDLAITLHRLGPGTREIGTALVEQLIATNAYEARQMLDEMDSRFRDSAQAARRPRLRRRSERASRRGVRRRGSTVDGA